uniref:F-box associated domain-containing protein n=1 Tax=Aegilops tauschii TaxID=37682 RepID=M8B881_AEGTA
MGCRHHTAPPLLAIAYRDDGEVNGVEISNIFGNLVKRIPITEYEIVLVNKSSGDAVGQISSKGDSIRVVRAQLDLVCFNWISYSRAFWVLNPATGATITLPSDFSEELVNELEVEGINKWRSQVHSCAFGQVSSTKEYKALRISTIGDRKVCEIITFNDMNQGNWRRKQDPPTHICAGRKMRCVVVNGYNPSFKVQRFVQENGYSPISLAELNGCLVMVHNILHISMDFWFLTDIKECIWVKKYSMPSHVARPCRYPFLMLDDGRIFFSEEHYLQCILGNGEPGEPAPILKWQKVTMN